FVDLQAATRWCAEVAPAQIAATPEGDAESEPPVGMSLTEFLASVRNDVAAARLLATAAGWSKRLAQAIESASDDSLRVEDNVALDSLAARLLADACRRVVELELLRSTDQRARLHEKLASLREFTYGASHELNNPLFNISSRAQVLLRDEADPERRRKLSTIYASAMRASEMIKDMALAARIPKPEIATVDATTVVQAVVDELAPHAREQQCALRLESPEAALAVSADPTQLGAAVREIVVNALESLARASRSGEVIVSLRSVAGDQVGADSTSSELAQSLEIAVVDDGPGLDARARRHLFDPFFSGYEAGRGMGFGLTKAWHIAEAHGGSLVVFSEPHKRTEFLLRLPLASADQ
ncbi:MAG: HAMP domain-containing histidine kinase, partial [Planctomycetales bacterium]|nr:HAMP domain-containing histidine kinase [Planctomycetales bacterium]